MVAPVPVAIALPTDPNALRRLADAIDRVNAALSFSTSVNPKQDKSMQIRWGSKVDDIRAQVFAPQLIKAVFANWDLLVAAAAEFLQEDLRKAQADAVSTVEIATAPVVLGPAP